MSISGISRFIFLFLAIQWSVLTVKADPMTFLDHPCTTTADCPKDSWTTCCDGKCVMGEEGCCPGETFCGGSLCCPKGQKCDEGAGKCVPDNACYPGTVMCQGKANPIGKCCAKDLCSSSGQCCLSEEEDICGEGCCTHGQCTESGVCCREENACGDSCCTPDKPICRQGKCTPYCDAENPCPSPYVCAGKKCCPQGSSTQLCGGECCANGSICVDEQCKSCPQGSKVCPCPPGVENCKPSCIPEFEICKNGVPTCPDGNILCGEICMNPVDRICKNGKIETCPEDFVVEDNSCKKCPPNNIVKDFKCQACSSGQVAVNNTCHTCITSLECRYSSPWDWFLTTNTCFSSVYATLKDGTVHNITSGGSWSQLCCEDLLQSVESLTELFFCPGVTPSWDNIVPAVPPYPHGCTPGACPHSHGSACENKCLNACKSGPSFIQVAACYWLCYGACVIPQSDNKKENKSN